VQVKVVLEVLSAVNSTQLTGPKVSETPQLNWKTAVIHTHTQYCLMR